jgi:hypothetical protein
VLDAVCFFFLKINVPSNYILNRFLCPKFIINSGDLNNSASFFFMYNYSK